MQRLKTRPQFQAALAGGTVARTPHFALHRAPLDVAAGRPQPSDAPERGTPALFPVTDAWIGAMVPKRWARRAVTRNAIKRQVYTISAALAAGFPPAAHVVRLRAGFDRKQFVSASSDALKQAVREELLQLFARAAPWRTPPSSPMPTP